MADGDRHPGGRPTLYTAELGFQICERIADGESLRQICLDDGMPGRRTILTWLSKDEEFRRQYAHAREAQADAIFDEIIEIADDGTNDYVEKTRQDGSTDTVFDAEHVQRSKLRVEARKWMAAKLAPKRYGEKLDMQLSGPDGGPIQSVGLVTDDPVEAAKTYQRLMRGE